MRIVPTAPPSRRDDRRDRETPTQATWILDTALRVALLPGLAGTAFLLACRSGLPVTSTAALVFPAVAMLSLVTVVGLAAKTACTGRSTAALVLVAALIASALLAGAIGTLPPIARDELVYHLALPALYVREGRILEVPFCKYSYYPLLAQMLFTPLVAADWLAATRYLHLSFGLATASLLLIHARRQGAGRAPALGIALVFLTTPVIFILATRAYVDLALAFYSGVALLGLLRWTETNRRTWLVLAGIAAGFTGALKYNGYFVIAMLLAAVPLLSDRRSLGKVVGDAVMFGAASQLPLLPWLVQNFVTTGNPVFPLLAEVLGGRSLDAAPAVSELVRRRELYGESWIEIALVPLRVFVTGAEGDPRRFDGVFNPIYLFAFLLLGSIRKTGAGARQFDTFLLLFAAAFLFVAVFLASASDANFQARFALPAVVALALALGSHAIPDATAAITSRRLLIAAMSIALVFNAFHIGRFIQHLDPLPYLAGGESRAAFTARFVAEYPVAAWANANLPRDEGRIYLVLLGNRGLHWEGPYTYDDHFLPVRLRRAIANADSATAIGDALRSQDIRYLAVAEPLLSRFLADNLSAEERARWSDFAAHHLRPLKRERGILLVEIID